MKRTPLKKQSNARAREMRLYYRERREWLALERNSRCAVCLGLGEVPAPATEVHHKFGRIGKLLRYQPGWIPCCVNHRETPHLRRKWAMEMGLIAPAAEWNTVPK